jgi:hypothetical protein
LSPSSRADPKRGKRPHRQQQNLLDLHRSFPLELLCSSSSLVCLQSLLFVGTWGNQSPLGSSSLSSLFYLAGCSCFLTTFTLIFRQKQAPGRCARSRREDGTVLDARAQRTGRRRRWAR